MTSEEMQKLILELQEKQTKLEDDNKTLSANLEDKIKREKELEEHNQKLFLKVTTSVKNDEEEKKKNNDEIKEYVGEKVFNVLTEKDLNKLNEILEGVDE